MKKFKPNIITTFMFSMLAIMGPFCVGIPLMILLMGSRDYNPVEMGLGFFLMLLLIVVFCSILHLITFPFTKYSVFLDEESFCREGGARVWYHDVTEIVFDSGLIQKSGGNEPCCLDCYSGSKMLFSVNHPSLVMTVMLIKRCTHAKVRYRRIKQIIGIWAFGLIVCVALGLYGRFNGQF